MSAIATSEQEQEQRRGFAVTAFTFVLWGLVPVYWHLLREVPSFQIIAHRIIWSIVLVAMGAGFADARAGLRLLGRSPKAWTLTYIAALTACGAPKRRTS